jgi:hypothetical protein
MSNPEKSTLDREFLALIALSIADLVAIPVKVVDMYS